MKRLLLILSYALLMSCQDKVICPAFQSTYILDDSTRNAYFSYVWQLDENTRTQYLAKQSGEDPNDTIGAVAQPKTDYYAYAGEKVVPWRIQKKTKYGIIKEPFYPVKNYQMRTAPMENVLAPEHVSNDFVASDFTDSLGVDSLSVAMDSLSVDTAAETLVAEEETKYLYGYDPSDNFNVEQQYYNKYFADKFIDNRPKPEPAPVTLDSLGNPIASDTVQTKEPFFKGLFKKKRKEEVGEVAPEEESLPFEETEESPEETSPENEEENGNG